MAIESDFRALMGFVPLAWQKRLYQEHFAKGQIPSAVDIPTGLGKTSVMALWLVARAHGAPLPRRLVYVVDRRAVVDQATEVAMSLREALRVGGAETHLREGLGLTSQQDLPISTLRGQFADNRQWQADPSLPAIIIGTVDMIGSRLLFEGYGVSRGMRPFHAGLLGADALIVLDEAHLVPPFEKLIEQIENGGDAYGPKAEEDRASIPPLRLMSLSATGGGRNGEVFRLTDADRDEVTMRRLDAAKALHFDFVEPTDASLEARLARKAWELSGEGKAAVRVIIFCDSRDSAEKTRDAIAVFAKEANNVEIEPPELFVGARRVREREDAKQRLIKLGFIAGGEAPTKSCFLIATSAGEVGVDLDADHLVCDLVSFERMVQRLGRVNRRGARFDTRIVVIEASAPRPKKPDAPTDAEKSKRARYVRAQSSKALLLRCATIEGDVDAVDASPGTLMRLKDQVGADAIAAASTPAPLRPALNRALVDAWSMTSLKEHTGRPEIGPWLRGWVEDEPQTTVIWRTHLPTLEDGGALAPKDIEAFFEAAPPSTNEQLDAETWRVLEWLKKRFAAFAKANAVDAHDIFGFVLTPSGDLRETLRPGAFVSTDKKYLDRAWEDVRRVITGGTLVLRAEFGGVRDGMLDDKADQTATCGDSYDAFETGFSVVVAEDIPDGRRIAFSRPIRFNAESDKPSKWLIVERGENQDGKALSKTAQLLAEHQDWAETAARGIVERLGVRGDIAEIVTLAARLHDEGKKAPNWQRAFKAPRDGVYGKTKGPINQAILDGYRHEFGSLPYAEQDPAFKALPPDARDLVLHLIAAHHGGARPVIRTDGCEDAPGRLLQDRARDVALRFARLQKRFGPWGLAWLEALVRAADQQASRQLEDRANG